MLDKMPEGMPVTKCINVMVGITRSKVFFCSHLIQLCPTYNKLMLRVVLVATVDLHGITNACGYYIAKLRNTLSGWWYTYPSEKYEFVSWDDDIPNIWENKIHVPNHQPAIVNSCAGPDNKLQLGR